MGDDIIVKSASRLTDDVRDTDIGDELL